MKTAIPFSGGSTAICFTTACATSRAFKLWSRKLTGQKPSRRSENRQLLRRGKAAQCLQGCGCLHFRGWALSQGIAQVFPVFDVPNWVIRSIVVMIILGLPVALVLAWMFELTPEGIKRTETADAMPEATRKRNTSGFMSS